MSAAPGAGEIRDYLLRRMSETGRARFEQAYFADDALLDRIEAEEDLLVSDYVLGRLPQDDRLLFEESLLGTPYYQERVETTSRLKLQIQSRSIFRKKAGGVPKHEAGLFPGRTGSVVAFAFMAVLALAAVTSAMRLRSDLKKANLMAAPAPPLSTARAEGVPLSQTLVLDLPQTPGPAFMRVSRPAGAPLLLVLSRHVLPPGAGSWDVALKDGDRIAWESGPHEAKGSDEGDLALRLPPGIPAEGNAGVVLHAQGAEGRTEQFLGVLEIRDR